MRRAPALAIALALVGQQASAQPQLANPEISAPAPVPRPVWIQRPTGQDLAENYPQRALNAEISGDAVVDCAVTTEGTVVDCRIVSEAPSGEGFGEAAIRLSKTFRMAPQTREGVSVAGARVAIPMAFRLPH